MRSVTLWFLLLVFVAPPASVLAQEWSTNSSVDSLVANTTITGVSSIHTAGDRVLLSSLRGDFSGYDVYYSDDSGETWNVATTDNVAGSFSVFASGEGNVLYSYGFDLFGGRYVRSSNDAGLTWTTVTPDGTNFPVIFLPQFMLASGNTLLLSGAGGNADILKSTDAGATWNAFTNFDGEEGARDLADLAQKGDTFWLASNDGGLYKASAAGTQWDLVREFGMQGGVDIFDVLVEEATGRIYITTTEGLEYSDDDGENWTLITTATLGIDAGTPDGLVFFGDDLMLQMANGADSKMYLIENLSTATVINEGLGAFESNNRFLALRSTSSHVFGIRIQQETALWQYGEGMVTSSIDEVEVPEIFTLDQNYPNPFNPATTISFTMTVSGYAKVYVSNLLGQHVLTLQEGFLTSGRHDFRFDAAGLPGGVYIYTLEVNDTRETRFMTLLK